MFEQLSDFRNSLPSLKSFRNMSPLARREFKNGVLFISPWLVGFLVFTLIPLLATLFFTFIDLNITDGILSKLYVVNGVARDVPMAETYRGVLPFLVSDAVRVTLLVFFPILSLWMVRMVG